MKKIDKLRVLQDIDLWEQGRKNYGPLKGGLRRFFIQDMNDPNMYSLGDKKVTKEEVDNYAKYSNIFVIVPASQMLKNRNKT